MKFARCTVLAALVCNVAAGPACKRTAEAPKHEGEPGAAHVHHDEDKGHEELPKLVSLSADVVREAKVTWAPAEKRRLAATLDLNGQVVADPDHIAMLGARVTGRVVKVTVREGDTVRAGQTIAALTSPDLAKTRADYAAASARATSARKNAGRLRSLSEQHLAADQDAVAAGAEAAAAEAERDAIAQAVRGMGAPLVARGDPSVLAVASPIGGQVVQRDAVPGQLVEPGHTIATVADMSRVFFQAQLFEKDLARVREGATCEVRLNGYPDKVFVGRVARVASQIDPQSRTLTARIVVAEASAEMKLGLFGSARLSLSEAAADDRVVIPLSAVTDIGERKIAFVRQADGHFAVHDVHLGPTAGGDVAVLSGLSAGEDVVVTGVHTLKSTVLKSALADED